MRRSISVCLSVTDCDSIVFEEAGAVAGVLLNIPQFWDYITSSPYVYEGKKVKKTKKIASK